MNKEINTLENEVIRLTIQKDNATTDTKERKLQKTIKKINRRINKLKALVAEDEDGYEAELEYRQLRGK
jgi:predicted translin family RNA/ssDNA-binding protein